MPGATIPISAATCGTLQSLLRVEGNLKQIETSLLRPSPQTLMDLEPSLVEATSLLSEAEHALRNGQVRDSESCREPMMEIRRRVRRIQRLMRQFGEFCEGWGRLVQAEMGYSATGNLAQMPVVSRGAARLDCEG